MEKEMLEEIKRKYGGSDKLIRLFIKICMDNNVNNIREQIDKFYLS